MIGIQMNENVDTISRLFPSFYQSTKNENEFLIHESFNEVIRIILHDKCEFFSLDDTCAKVMLNDRYAAIETANQCTRITFGEYIDYVICRIFHCQATFWNNSSFSDSFDSVVVLHRHDAEVLIKDLERMYEGDIAVMPYKKLLSIKKNCTRVF